MFCWDVRHTLNSLYVLSRDTARTNQRIGFDIEPAGKHLATGGCGGRVQASGAARRGAAQHGPRRCDRPLRLDTARMSGSGPHCAFREVHRSVLGGLWLTACTLAYRASQVFDLAEGCEVQGCAVAGDPVNGVAFHPCLDLMACASGETRGAGGLPCVAVLGGRGRPRE